MKVTDNIQIKAWKIIMSREGKGLVFHQLQRVVNMSGKSMTIWLK